MVDIAVWLWLAVFFLSSVMWLCGRVLVVLRPGCLNGVLWLWLYGEVVVSVVQCLGLLDSV